MPNPVPEKICPEAVLEEVTYGYVPKSISNNEPWAPSNKIVLLFFPNSFKIFHVGLENFLIYLPISDTSLNKISASISFWKNFNLL